MSVAERQMARACLTLTASGEAGTRALAAALARQCRSGDCLLLSGDLGSGKTTFARGFIEALAPDCGDIVSPTFTLVQTYTAASGTPIAHFDLYRLRSPTELGEIGLDEALHSGIVLIEWPKLMAGCCPPDALDIVIATGDHPEQRMITFSGPASAWQLRLQTLQKALL